MIKDIKDVCFIVQARVNSERVPGKMVRPFYKDKTLTDIVLQKLVDIDIIPNEQIYLAAHEDELIKIGEKYPINLYRRSYESANSDNGIQTLFEWWNKLPYTYVVMVSGCAPLLLENDIEDFVEVYLDSEKEGGFAVVKEKNYYWNYKGEMLNNWPAGQDLLNTKAVEPTYRAAHCLYASRMDSIGQGKWVGDWKNINDNIELAIVEELGAYDIDTVWQWEAAKVLYKKFMWT